jgi:multicomponent Na+:H+ antiporter subunit F
MIILGAKIALYILIAAFILVMYRLIKGPELADRVIAIDLLAFLAAGMMLLTMIITGKKEYMDIVIILSLVVFIATVAISKYLTKGGQND